jgi:hypothetical protein
MFYKASKVLPVERVQDFAFMIMMFCVDHAKSQRMRVYTSPPKIKAFALGYETSSVPHFW